MKNCVILICLVVAQIAAFAAWPKTIEGEKIKDNSIFTSAMKDPIHFTHEVTIDAFLANTITVENLIWGTHEVDFDNYYTKLNLQTTGEALVNGANIFNFSGAGKSNLYELDDVDIPSPASGEVLVYNGGTAVWEAKTVAGTGDMLKSVYDSNNDGIVNEADHAADAYTTAEVDSKFTSYYTKTNLQTTGEATVNWANVSNQPAIGEYLQTVETWVADGTGNHTLAHIPDGQVIVILESVVWQRPVVDYTLSANTLTFVGGTTAGDNYMFSYIYH